MATRAASRFFSHSPCSIPGQLLRLLFAITSLSAELVVGEEETSAALPTIEWDASTRKLIAPGGTYARIIHLRSGDLLCCYQRQGQSCLRRNQGTSKTWSDERVMTGYPYGIAANPELLQRRNGEIWLLYNERPRQPGHPYAISLLVSRDDGKSWTDPKRLFTGGTEFGNGCWEPVALEYPDGEVQVFFANETPYTGSDEQEISMISSVDFRRVHTVSFRKRARDGMPVPCLLHDGKSVVIAIEDSGLNGRMKPVILFSTLSARWRKAPIAAGDQRRRPALKNPLTESVYAGAPYLVAMASGITLLSVQSDEGRQEPRMVVYVGDRRARQFTNPTVPFPVNENQSGLWNSLLVKNSNTVTAVSATTLEGSRGIWVIDGRLRLSVETGESQDSKKASNP